MTTTYFIRVREHLGEHWQGYFGGLELSSIPHGNCQISELRGELNEAALQATLRTLSDLNLHLLSVNAQNESQGGFS